MGYATGRGSIIMPSEDHTSNPLRASKYSNLSCVCDSGKKVKKCCGKDLYVPKFLATEIKEMLQLKKLTEN